MDEKFEYKDTILRVKCDRDIRDLVRGLIFKKRQELDAYILKNPGFQSSFEPVDVGENAPEIAKTLSAAGKKADTGPMAAVAGAVSEIIVKEAAERGAGWAIAENGGDVCLWGNRDFNLAIYAGRSPLSGKIGFSLNPGEESYGVCTSSGSVGHSISLGESDSVTVFAKETPLADAFATAIGNKVDTIDSGLKFAEKHMDKIDGVIIIKEREIGKIGKLPELFSISKSEGDSLF
jgi:hypothetical protein